MEQNTLAKLRMFAPPFLILCYWWLGGVLTGLWESALPSWEEVPKSTPALFIAAAYYVTPARSFFNRRYFDRVTKNLRDGMVRIAGRRGSEEHYSWKDIRSVFFVIVDGDPSLTRKAHQAYFNGFLWTSAADARALAAAATFISFGWGLFDAAISNTATLVFFGIFALSYLFSMVITKKHISIGDEQLEIIEHFYSAKVTEHFDRLDA